jgi:hypothetical protein
VEDIDHSRTKAHHPQTNGICERFHETCSCSCRAPRRDENGAGRWYPALSTTWAVEGRAWFGAPSPHKTLIWVSRGTTNCRSLQREARIAQSDRHGRPAQSYKRRGYGSHLPAVLRPGHP